MSGVLVDSNVLLDIFTNDPEWADWSESTLEIVGADSSLYINPIIYSEISIGFERIEALENGIKLVRIELLALPRESLFLAGKVYLQYRKQKGTKHSTLPDFFIGAHAAVSNLKLVTRDVSRYRTYFPTVELLTPSK